MKEKIEDNWEEFSRRKFMILDILLDNFNISLLFKIIRLDGDGQIISIIFLDLHNNTNSHCFLSKGHLDDLMKIRT
jgi:hypothetical protein